MKQIILLIIFFAFVAAGHSQTRERQSCPDFDISAPKDYIVKAGQTATFTVLMPKESDSNLSYNWMISTGTLLSGQGKKSIQVDTKGLAGYSLTVTLEIKGLPEGCLNVKSTTVDVVEKR